MKKPVFQNSLTNQNLFYTIPVGILVSYWLNMMLFPVAKGNWRRSRTRCTVLGRRLVSSFPLSNGKRRNLPELA
jgi:hypothetical protein